MKITKSVTDKVTRLAAKGLTKLDVGIAMGYSRDHWYKLVRGSDKLLDAYNVGRTDMKKLLLNQSMSIALDDSHKDCTTNIWKLVDRLDRDGVDTVADVSVDVTVDVKSQILEELQ